MRTCFGGLLHIPNIFPDFLINLSLAAILGFFPSFGALSQVEHPLGFKYAEICIFRLEKFAKTDPNKPFSG